MIQRDECWGLAQVLGTVFVAGGGDMRLECGVVDG